MAHGREPAGLFQAIAPRPLADSLRPQRLEDVLGQDHLLGADGALRRMIEAGRLSSIILWGPPGSGKTTIARLLAQYTHLAFEPLSAVFSGVAELKRVFETAQRRRQDGVGTLLFIDEIHRFNRSQQNSFLPYVEDGTVILVGATTENPSFELIPPLLSRCRVLILNRLDDRALEALLQRAEQHLGRSLPLDREARQALRAMADGDGRYLLNLIETLTDVADEPQLSAEDLARLLQRRRPVYDKGQESHYNLMSALHKALRGSDVDAALYWLARMLEGGEDPRYIARRLVRFAVEDVGMADPAALQQALAAWQAYERLGSPEGDIALVQGVVYLGSAPKSNALYRAEAAARRLAQASGSLMPPAHALNAPTQVMREIGYGRGYIYDHDTEAAFAGLSYFPEGVERTELYQPSERGFEAAIAKRLQTWARLRQKNTALGSDQDVQE
jgi:putative ATPase